MEGTAPLNTTTEYVIQLEEGHILQSQDLEQIVSLAIINANGDQVYTLQDGTVAAIGPGTYQSGDVVEHVVTSHPMQEEVDQSVNVITSENSTEIVNGAEGGVISCQSSEQEHALQSYTLRTSDCDGIATSGRPVMITVSTDSGQTQQKKCTKKKRTNQNVSVLSKDMLAVDQEDETAVVQPFTVETITNTLRSGRAYNTTKTIFDYLMYEKFPPGYTTNQKQALREVKDNYIIVDKQLYYRCKKGKIVRLLLVIHDEQPDVKLKILQDGHISKSGSHNGINKTIGQIKEFFFWHGLTDHVRFFVKSCHLCHLRQAVAKERDKLVHLNMEHTPTFSVSSEGQELSNKVDRLVKEHKRLQNNLRQYESSELVETIKKNVAHLNDSILSHLELSQPLSGETAREVTSLTGKETNNVAGGEFRRTVEGERSDKMEDLKLLETMMPNKRVHNHSRLIEEIIRTNTYPKTLNAGKISGLAQVKTHFLMVNDELYRVFSKRGRMLNVAKVIHDDEPDVKKRIMKVCHVDETGKHNGMNRTLTIVNESFYWQSMSIHIKMFVDYCPVCRNRRGVSNKMSNRYVAESNDIEDICLKLSTEPKETWHEVEGSLGLTPEDYLTVRQLAGEVKDLNEWLFKNPTIKDEWEHMFERSFRGPKWYDYDEDGMRIYRKNNSDKGHKDFISKPFKAAENFESGHIQIVKMEIDDENLKYEIAEVRDQSIQTDTGSSKASSAEAITERSNMTKVASDDSVVQSGMNENIHGSGMDYVALNVSLDENGEKVNEDLKVGDSANDENDKGSYNDKNENANVSNDEGHVEDVKKDFSDECDDKNKNTMDTCEKIETGDMYNEQKVSNAEDTSQEKSVECSEPLEIKNLERNESNSILGDNTESSPANGKETAVRRSSKRLESKLLSKKAYSQMDCYKIAVKTKQVKSINVAKVNKMDMKETSHSVNKKETEITTSCRHSVRKRKMTPKFSGFVKSKGLKILAGSGHSVSEMIPKDIAAGGNDSQNKRKKLKDGQKEELMASQVKQLEDEKSDKQKEEQNASPVKQLEDKKVVITDTSLAKTKTKPIMQSTNIRLIARKPRNEVHVHVGKDLEQNKAMLAEDKAIHGPVTRRKAKGTIMKNSDVHIVKRKTKEDQVSNILDNIKVPKLSEQNLSTVSCGQNQIRMSSISIDTCLSTVPESDEKAKTILVPRNRKGLMTKTDLNVIRRKSVETVSAVGKTDFSHHKESLGVSSDKKMDEDENIQTEVGVRRRQNSLLSEQLPCDSKGNTSIYSQMSSHQREVVLKSQETNNSTALKERTLADSVLETHLGESDVIDSERLRDKSLTKGQHAGRTPEKNMNYVIDFKKTKQDTVESSYQKKYKEFVGTDTAKSKCAEIPSDAGTKKDMPATEICMTNKGAANILSNLDKSSYIKGDSSNEKYNMERNQTSDFVAHPNISSHFNHKERIAKLGSPIVIIKVNNELAAPGDGSGNIIQDTIQTNCRIVRHIGDNLDNSSTVASGTAMHYVEKTMMLPQPSHNNTKHSKTSLETKDTVERIGKEEKNTQQDCHTLGRNFDCPLCMKRFDDEKSYFLHKGDLCKVECQFCSLLFDAKQRDRIDKHKQRHKAGFSYMCSACENVFLSSEVLNIHERIHVDKREVICTECNETFYSFFYLTSHCESEHDIPVVYICDICSARFGSKDFLTERHLSNGNLSFYSCTLCESKL